MMEEIIAQEISIEKEKAWELFSFAKLDSILKLVLFITLKDIFHKKNLIYLNISLRFLCHLYIYN